MPDDVPLAPQPGQLTPARAPAALPPGPAVLASPARGPAVLARPVGRSDAWDTGMARWDLFYAIVFVAGLIIVEVSSHGTQRIVGLAALAAMLPWYLLVGRPHI
ncbi:MAG: hypothetical protein WBH47_27915, partial [Streptosporangiaceae bacterium]